MERAGPSDAPFHLKISHHQSSGIMLNKYEFEMPFILKRTYQSMARVDQEFICIHYRIKGRDTGCFFQGGECPTRPGNIRYHDLTRQYVVDSRGLTGFTLYIDRALLLDHMPSIDHLHGDLMADSPVTRVFKTTLRSAFEQFKHANASEAASLSGILTAIAIDAIKLQRIKDLESSEIGQMSVLQAVVNHIKQNCHKRDCTPESIAKAIGVSRTKLYRVSQPFDTPMELVRQIRLRKAAEVLRKAADTNIANLADSVGFSGRQAFTRAFTAEYEVSPKDYRKAMRSAATATPVRDGPVDIIWKKLEESFKNAQIA
ncbi:helix-turn-helix transcriptional regulator [Hoeflea sp. TYP-13]|uniref:helix-turn-helix transcriptional regulator n=1 Tax=Hoeflea sp. TYP-13 TaxID=3230023 RepID=UPI0034C69BDA